MPKLSRRALPFRWISAVTAAGLVAAALFLLPKQGVCAEPVTPARAILEQSKRIVVLGDSITYGGRWVAILNAWMESQGMTAELIDVGLSSDCSEVSALLRAAAAARVRALSGLVAALLKTAPLAS